MKLIYYHLTLMIQVYSKYLCKFSKPRGFMWGQELPAHYTINLHQIKYNLSSHICHKPPVSSSCLLRPLCPSEFLLLYLVTIASSPFSVHF